MISSFKDKKVFIAGGTGGIGRSIATLFADQGATVFIHGRDNGKFAGFVGITQEINNEDDAIKVIDEALRFLENIDIFVSVIGSGKSGATALLSQEEWQQVLMQNFLSTTLLIKAASSHLKGTDPNIVVIGSIAGVERLKAPVGYTVAKSALNAYVHSSAPEFAKKGVRINIVHPGNIYFKGGRWEEIKKQDEEGTFKYINEAVPQKRFGKPEEVASAVLFLSSPQAKFITGSSLIIDGGQHVSF